MGSLTQNRSDLFSNLLFFSTNLLMMPEIKILIVEDDQKIANLLITYFKRESWTYDHAITGKIAQHLINENYYSLIILDLMLPEIDGTQLCREIREKSDIPIIMITAKDTESDKISGLTIGADDYITKPFSINEVIARIKVQLRRHTKIQNHWLIEHNGIELSVDQHEVKVHSRQVDLTLIEFDLLRYFLERVGQIITKQQLLKDVWKQDIILDENTVMV
ncbi:MAG: response regulator transcription factor, partial [Calditrichaeota bacterium]|nr:response regulator transcription factor [Calditrichota bacterium]